MKYKYYVAPESITRIGGGLPNTQSYPTLEKAVSRDCDLPFRGWDGKTDPNSTGAHYQIKKNKHPYCLLVFIRSEMYNLEINRQ